MDGNLVTVDNEGQLTNIREEFLRSGDMVVLQAGDLIPADLILQETRGLEVDEFDITGEILPVVKKAGDRDSKLYMGSKVLRGAGKGQVVATGEHTEYGQILKQEWISDRPHTYPIFKRKYLILVGLLLPALAIFLAQYNQDGRIAAVFFAGSIILILLQNDGLFQSSLVAKGLRHLGRLGIHIRDKRAFTELPRIDLMCFDKTGVLTTRRMDVKRIYAADKIWSASEDLGERPKESLVDLVITACALCNDVQFYEKFELANPIDKALIWFAEKNGVDVKRVFSLHPRFFDVPFDSENRYMACGFKWDRKEMHFIKGDPQVILQMCSHYETVRGITQEVDHNFWRFYLSTIDAISQIGDTTIALAFTTSVSNGRPNKYSFLCLVQLENSIQAGARELIAAVTRKGIRSILLTGDRAKTAVRVGSACGIANVSQACLTGKMIARMGSAEVARQSISCSLFAELIPSQKGYILWALKQKGHYTAMIGDGPNDGIAIKVADIGISFVTNSSPVARRLSKILVPDLASVLPLLESAQRVERRTRCVKLLRMTILILALISPYLWIICSQ